MAFSAKYIEDVINKQLKSNGRGSMEVIHEDACKKYGEELRTIVWSFIHTYIKSFPITAIIVGEPVKRGDELVINMSFDEDALWRDSLLSVYSNTKYGTDDIVLQFEKGWKPKKTGPNKVYGYWASHDKYTYARRSYPGSSMLANAIRSFNATAPDGVKAVLKPPYK